MHEIAKRLSNAMYARVLEALAEPRSDPGEEIDMDNLCYALQDLDPDFATVCDSVSRTLDDMPAVVLHMHMILGFNQRGGGKPADIPSRPRIDMDTHINRNGTLVAGWRPSPASETADFEYFIATGGHQPHWHRIASIFGFMVFTARATPYGASKRKGMPGYTDAEWSLMEIVRDLIGGVRKAFEGYLYVTVEQEMFADRTSPETSAPYIPERAGLYQLDGVAEFLSERKCAFLPPEAILEIRERRVFAEFTKKNNVTAEQILSAHKISGGKPKKTLESLGIDAGIRTYASLRSAIGVIRRTQPNLYAKYFHGGQA